MAFRSTKINPRGFHVSQLKFYFILVPLAVFMAIPLVFIFFNAFKSPNELFAFPPRVIPKHPTLENFRSLFSVMTTSGIPVSRYLFNSVVISASTVFLSILLSTLAGYVLSKKNFRAKKLIFEINTLALMFVPISVSIPRYIVIARLGLIDNFLAHLLPNLAMPVGLFLVKQFIDQIPDSLIEAAKIDGANEWFIYFRIILPLTKPAVATVAILAFQSAWNATEASLIYINDEALKNFAYYMSTLSGGAGSVAGQGLAAAAALIMFLPNLVIFVLAQSKVMNTMAHSGIK